MAQTQQNLYDVKLEQSLYNYINNNFAHNIDNFCQCYYDVNTFLSSQYGTIFQHFVIPNDMYINICNKIKERQASLSNDSTIQQQAESEPNKKIKKLNVAGFVDTLILAFITGSFIGIVILNIYSKIVENI